MVTEALENVNRHRTQRRFTPWTCTHGWRLFKGIMARAKIPDGPQKSPKGLRHGFGVAAISAGIPLNMLCKWMGHASTETPAIYANAVGEEEQSIAVGVIRFERSGPAETFGHLDARSPCNRLPSPDHFVLKALRIATLIARRNAERLTVCKRIFDPKAFNELPD